jgi:WD40 repeat protein
MGHGQLASILVGDHLGQVKKVLWPSGEISLLSDLAEPDKSNPIVSIDPIIGSKNKHLIASKNGLLYVYDSIRAKTKQCDTTGADGLVKAATLDGKQVILVYDKHVSFAQQEIKQKKGQIKNAKAHVDKLALVGKDIPLKVFDTKTRNKIYEAETFDKNWLGIQPDCEVVGLDFVGQDRIVTCSKSDSVIRVYDMNSKPKPVISIDIGHTAFNEYAEAGRFMSVASTGEEGHKVVVGSNVGQMLAIDLRFNVKVVNPKKRLQPKTSKILGGFKGPRGATVKDIKIVPSVNGEKGFDYKVISCCLDRYLRIHNFSKTSRQLDKHVYMKTKPLCCSPIFYEDI